LITVESVVEWMLFSLKVDGQLLDCWTEVCICWGLPHLRVQFTRCAEVRVCNSFLWKTAFD